MCREEFFLSLKENLPFFTFLQQCMVYLLVTTPLLSVFAFASATRSNFIAMQNVLQLVCYIKIIITLFVVFVVVWTYVSIERHKKRMVGIYDGIYDSVRIMVPGLQITTESEAPYISSVLKDKDLLVTNKLQGENVQRNDRISSSLPAMQMEEPSGDDQQYDEVESSIMLNDISISGNAYRIVVVQEIML